VSGGLLQPADGLKLCLRLQSYAALSSFKCDLRQRKIPFEDVY